MAHIVQPLDVPSTYQDRTYKSPKYYEDLAVSTTLYVGNLSFFTTEEQIYELFSKCGEIKRIIMGLDRNQKTPCGFCFVEYYTRKAALNCLKYVSGTKLDERIIRCDLDSGYREGRQFGRGRSGGQVRDEYRTEFDAGRGGWGHYVKQTGTAPTPVTKRRRHGSNGPPPGRQEDAYGESVVELTVNDDVDPGSKRKRV